GRLGVAEKNGRRRRREGDAEAEAGSRRRGTRGQGVAQRNRARPDREAKEPTDICAGKEPHLRRRTDGKFEWQRAGQARLEQGARRRVALRSQAVQRKRGLDRLSCHDVVIEGKNEHALARGRKDTRLSQVTL